MKKKFLCSTLAMAMAASMLFGCASESKTETTAAAAETTAEAAKAETNGEKLKVTLLVTGSFGDKAFNDSAQAGMEKLEAELGDKVEVNMVEMGSDKTKFEGSMLDACESDADLIITGLWDMKEITEKVAQEFPEKKFIIFDTDVDYTLGDLSNVYSMSYKQNEGSYLAGVLAALVTESKDMPNANEDKKIGFVGGSEHPIITDFLVGYIAGAKSVDPDIKVYVSYIGSWDDTAKGKETAIAQYNQGVDIIFPAAEQAGLGCVEAAAEMGKYIIGVDSDQAMLFSGSDEAKANVILSSVLKNVGDSLVRMAEMEEEGTVPYGKCEFLGLKENGAGLADNEYFQKNVPDEIKQAIEEKKQEVLDGKIEIPTALGDADQNEVQALIDSVAP